MTVSSFTGKVYKNIEYSVDHYYQDGKQVFQAWYCGQTTNETFRSYNRALAKARQIAETVRQKYMATGTPARTVFIDPLTIYVRD